MFETIAAIVGALSGIGAILFSVFGLGRKIGRHEARLQALEELGIDRKKWGELRARVGAVEQNAIDLQEWGKVLATLKNLEDNAIDKAKWGALVNEVTNIAQQLVALRAEQTASPMRSR